MGVSLVHLSIPIIEVVVAYSIVVVIVYVEIALCVRLASTNRVQSYRPPTGDVLIDMT